MNTGLHIVSYAERKVVSVSVTWQANKTVGKRRERERTTWRTNQRKQKAGLPRATQVSLNSY